jgi:hypothetical protein
MYKGAQWRCGAAATRVQHGVGRGFVQHSVMGCPRAACATVRRTPADTSTVATHVSTFVYSWAPCLIVPDSAAGLRSAVQAVAVQTLSQLRL